MSRDESAESRDGVLKVGGTSANLRKPSEPRSDLDPGRRAQLVRWEWDDEQEAERLAARRARKEKELAMLADSVGSGDLGLNLGSKMLKRVAGAASVQPQALE